MGAKVEMFALRGLPRVAPGDDLAELLAQGFAASELQPRDGDVVVVAQKIVSKAEGRLIDLGTVNPSPRAERIAREVEKDPRLVELILRESVRIVRQRKDVLIVEHRLGLVMANAGIDQSNVETTHSAEPALLLPEDPDASASRLRAQLSQRHGVDLAVIINDSFGRPWRRGTVGVAIGCAGLPALRDLRGQPDLFGRTLRVTEVGLADELAAAASLLMGQAAEAQPVVLIRGLTLTGPSLNARSLIRSQQEDLFR
ncbi:MAG: coenzyme F420-0:L-glutamate ligase [Gammaproteobacteria bacterium]|nr:coenzyme F420-0:L-glutamate ligase [Gammaproteobacteria bacterium]